MSEILTSLNLKFYLYRSAALTDTRNVIDRYKGLSIEEIVRDLDMHGVSLEIAIENLKRDYNMGTIVRSANAFGVRRIHVVGRRQWNKRGAMMTDKYLHVEYHKSVQDFVTAASERTLIAIDNVPGSIPLQSADMPTIAILVFGSEGEGLSSEMLAACAHIVAIEQLGSTRSLNVGVAAGIAMYEWLRQQGTILDKTSTI